MLQFSLLTAYMESSIRQYYSYSFSVNIKSFLSDFQFQELFNAILIVNENIAKN